MKASLIKTSEKSKRERFEAELSEPGREEETVLGFFERGALPERDLAPPNGFYGNSLSAGVLG